MRTAAVAQIRRFALNLPNPRAGSRRAPLPIGRRMAMLRQLDRGMFELFGGTDPACVIHLRDSRIPRSER